MDDTTLQFPHPALYRYLSEREHVADFLAGNVWVSTLSHVRHCDEMRADVHDSVHEYVVDEVSSQLPAEEQKTIAENFELLGMQIENSTDIKVYGTLPEAYVFCCSSKKDDPTLRRVFGEYCVEIQQPLRFFEALQRAVLNHDPAVFSAPFDEVKYAGRTFINADAVVGTPGFASIEKLSYEAEWRLLGIRLGYCKLQGFKADLSAIASSFSLVTSP